MKNLVIFDHIKKHDLSGFRGGGRVMQILKENFDNQANFVDNLSHINYENTLIIPSWQPFQPPRLTKHIAKKN